MYMEKMKFLLFVFSSCVWWCMSLAYYDLKKVRVGLGEPNLSSNEPNVEDKWFVQKLDHFNPTDTRTWNQRYFVNTSFYQNSGPVFLMISGEAPMSPKWMYSGAWIDYAKEFNALCISLEHRYYGKSHPTKNMTTENLVYLSSEQALADLAEFIVNIKDKYNVPLTAKWVAFGGSYSGTLAAWLRMKYPHLVHMAVASSAPLLAKIDFKEYFEVVENSLGTYSMDCVSQIKQATQSITNYLKTKEGSKIIQDKFELCVPLDNNNRKDISNFFNVLSGNIADIVQYNKDNRLSKDSNSSLITIDTICDIMVNKSIKNSLDRYAVFNNLMLSYNNLSCTNYTYTKMIDSYLDTAWNNDSEVGGRQWMYQVCTEFGFFQTSNQNDHIFGDQFPVDFFIDLCSDIYGNLYNLNLLSDGIERTNMMYGALNIREERVIYVQGSIDPWHALGKSFTKMKNTVAIYINGTAHCADMYPINIATDLPQLTKARTTIKAYLNEWLSIDDILDPAEVDNIQFNVDPISI